MITTINISYLTVSIVQEIGSILAGWFQFRISHEGPIKCLLGPQSSESLNGAKRSASKMACSHAHNSKLALGRRPQFLHRDDFTFS